MTAVPDDSARSGRVEGEDRSFGDIVSQLSSDASRLIRQEIQLAKTEAKEEARKAGLAAGMLGGAGVTGLLTLLFLSLTVVYALAHVMDVAWAALIVTVVWAVVTALLAVTGRSRLASVDPRLDQTTESLKEDARWVTRQSS